MSVDAGALPGLHLGLVGAVERERDGEVVDRNVADARLRETVDLLDLGLVHGVRVGLEDDGRGQARHEPTGVRFEDERLDLHLVEERQRREALARTTPCRPPSGGSPASPGSKTMIPSCAARHFEAGEPFVCLPRSRCRPCAPPATRRSTFVFESELSMVCARSAWFLLLGRQLLVDLGLDDLVAREDQRVLALELPRLLELRVGEVDGAVAVAQRARRFRCAPSRSSRSAVARSDSPSLSFFSKSVGSKRTTTSPFFTSLPSGAIHAIFRGPR